MSFSSGNFSGDNLDSKDLDARVSAARARYVQKNPASAATHDEARRFMPGGNTRSVLHFDPFPFRVRSAAGAELTSIDGQTYVDFCGNYTAGLLGHSADTIRHAVADAMEDGVAIGAVHEREVQLARLICERFQSLEQVRFTNSGTEANLMAIGTAIHNAGRNGVGVFSKAYHGGVLSFGESTAGPLNVPHQYVIAPFNETEGLDDLFACGELACVLVEPVQGSGGCRPADRSFLLELRRRCTAADVVLIFDEVMTSRLAPGGAQQLFDVTPDMTTLGKYLGGGMSFGAFGGRADLMANFDPLAGGSLSQAGTFNNNTVSMAAAIATLTHELDDDLLSQTNRRGEQLRSNLNDLFTRMELPISFTGLGSMLCAHSQDDRWLELFFHAMLDRGNYFARRGFMALSFCITDNHVAKLLADAADWAARLESHASFENEDLEDE